MDIIRKRERKTGVQYMRSFEWRDHPGAGFSFECDEHGELEPLTNEAARENWEGCVSGEYDVVDQGVERREWSWVEHAVGRCESCGREVELAHFTNTCECGADYNSCGQRLGPREFWGEETGEHLSDILRIP